jgi:hypothetical protein
MDLDKEVVGALDLEEALPLGPLLAWGEEGCPAAGISLLKLECHHNIGALPGSGQCLPMKVIPLEQLPREQVLMLLH